MTYLQACGSRLAGSACTTFSHRFFDCHATLGSDCYGTSGSMQLSAPPGRRRPLLPLSTAALRAGRPRCARIERGILVPAGCMPRVLAPAGHAPCGCAGLWTASSCCLLRRCAWQVGRQVVGNEAQLRMLAAVCTENSLHLHISYTGSLHGIFWWKRRHAVSAS